MLKLEKVNSIMFSKSGTYPPAGMFTWAHLGLVLFFTTLAVLVFIFTRKWNKGKIMRFLQVLSIILITLEIFKIIWNISSYGFSVSTMNKYTPLYYCSLFLYALPLFAFGKGSLAHASRAWLVYGGIIAGVAFLIYPSSSLLEYPFFHFLSLHSIFFHTFLVLTSVILLYHKLYVPRFRDFGPFLYFSFYFMALAFFLNKTLGLNLMFLEAPLALPFFEVLNAFSPALFQIIMFVAQLALPFVFSHLIFLFLTKVTKHKFVVTTQERHKKSDK